MESLEAQGVAIPRLGLGTFRIPGRDCRPAVEHALSLGYRHIDTAAMYDNEDAVGAAIATSGLARKDLFVTTKVWRDQLDPADIRRALGGSLARLRMDYVDLYLVHWPTPTMDMEAVLQTLAALRDEGRVRAIGVCNFNMSMMRRAVEEIGAPIATLQVEYHPFLDQSAMLGFLRSRNILLTAYSPLAQGRAAADLTLQSIAAKHNATAAQVAIAWLLGQDDVMAIPKAVHPANQLSNLQALKLALDDDDRAAIAALPKNQRFVQPSFAPDWNA